jgi:hypothetical protein
MLSRHHRECLLCRVSMIILRHRVCLFILVGCLAATFFSVTHLSADVILPSLPAGSQYQLVFVTSNSRDATSADIADYNTFVMSRAAASSTLPTGVTWRAVASTLTVSAADNAIAYTSVPIYNTHGVLVASGREELWSGGLLANIDYDQNGNARAAGVWTGSHWDGSAYSGNELGNSNGYASIGYTSLAPGWLFPQNWIEDGTGFSQGQYKAFYALSSPITVPEPSVLALLATGTGGLLLIAWRRRQARP